MEGQRVYHARQSQHAGLHISSDPEPEQATPPTKQRRTYYAFDEDDQAVAAIRQRYGVSTDSDAVRLALRLVAGDAIQVKTAAPATRRIVIKLKARTRPSG